MTFREKSCKKSVVMFWKFQKKAIPLHSQSGKQLTVEKQDAEIAQLVEHNLAKVRVASSSLVFRSKIEKNDILNKMRK